MRAGRGPIGVDSACPIACRDGLPIDYQVVDDVDLVPDGLRGLHRDNPTNRPRGGGVQIELPPTIRWNRDAHEWSDVGDTPRAPHVDLLIDALATALESWEC